MSEFSEQAKKDFARHLVAQHAMQSGVALTGGSGQTPKHLRVGVNTALADHAALVKLLVSKGVISYEEYASAIAAGMEAEAMNYERKLGLPGCDVSLA